MPFCPYCGKKVRYRDIYCSGCGRSLEELKYYLKWKSKANSVIMRFLNNTKKFNKNLKKLSYPRILLLVLSLILIFIGSVNAYDLIHVPEEGRPIIITDEPTYNPYLRFFERTDVLEIGSKTSNNKVHEEKIEPPTTLTATPFQMIEQESQRTSESPSSSPSLTNELIPPTTSQSAEQSSTNQSLTPPAIKPVSRDDIQNLSNKIKLYSLKDGAIIELHIRGSQGEIFRIYVQNKEVHIIEGESNDEDIELWFSTFALEELQRTNDISSTAGSLYSDGQISIYRKASLLTLWWKGYKSLAEELGFDIKI
jgi:predicted Fe-S protein YdhL (DUF1289 family)